MSLLANLPAQPTVDDVAALVPAEFRPMFLAQWEGFGPDERAMWLTGLRPLADAFERDDYPAFRAVMERMGYDSVAAVFYAALDANRTSANVG